jgi:hypothetical protein
MRQGIAALIVTFSLCGSAIPADFVHREVNQKNPGGKDLIMTFREVSRDERTSLAKVTFRSGASVPSSMFVARGFYDIAKARGAKYFINLKEWDGPDGDRMYLVGLSNDRNVSISQYFRPNEAPSAPDQPEFLSVDEFARIFEGRK